MSPEKSLKNPRRSPGEPDVGVINPDELWGRPLYLQPLYDASLPFEARVERAWEHVKATRFTADEHERLRVALAVKIEAKLRNTSRIS